MDVRIPRSLGTVFLLTGAFAIGSVLHQALVQQTLALTSPFAVFASLAGIGLIVLGRRLEREFDPSEFIPKAPEDEEEGFDEALSPLDEHDLEGYEADEDYRA